MTISEITKSVVVQTGQSYTTETFEIAELRNDVRKLTGIPDFQINAVLPGVVQDFTKKTWILQKTIEVGDVIAAEDSYAEVLTDALYSEILTDEDYEEALVDDDETDDDYAVTIDLSTYSDGLLPFKINKIYLNDTETKITPLTYIGYPSTMPEGVFYEISGTSIKIFPVALDDTIQIPVIFKTDLTETDIPIVLEDYQDELVAGVIAKLMRLPQYKDNDEFIFNDGIYKQGISKAKNKWFLENSPSKVSGAGTRHI